MTYKILYSGALRTLEKDVKDSVELGWAPQGGVSVHGITEDRTNFYQAMTRVAVDKQLNG